MTVRLFFGRPRPGTVGETRRVVHVFEVPTNIDMVPENMTAFCGAAFSPGALELLGAPQGMPCESCLRRAPTTGPELTDGSPEHENEARATPE